MEGTTKLIETYQNEDLMSLLRLMAPDKKGDDDNYPQIDFIIYLSKRDFPIGDILDINTYDIQGSNSTTDVTDSIESTTCDIETLRSLPQHPLDQMCFQISETNLSCDGFNKVLKVLPTYFDEYLITHLSASIQLFDTAQVYTFSRFMKQRTNLKIKFSSGYIKDLKKNTKEEF